MQELSYNVTGIDWDLKTCERKYVVFKARMFLHIEKSADKPRYKLYVYTHVRMHAHTHMQAHTPTNEIH